MVYGTGKKLSVALLVVFIQGCSSTNNQAQVSSHSFDQPQLQQDHSKAPIPYSELLLPSQVAASFKHVTLAKTVLEGASFDRNQNLIFSDVKGRQLLRMSPAGEVTTVANFSEGSPGGTAVHRNGEIYVALISDQYKRGSIIAISPDGRSRRTIISPDQGYVPNDLVFDSAGGFYFTDFRGNSTDPAGGVYYVSPDGKVVAPILKHLSLANGVALSPSGKTLWVTEYGRNVLHKITLENATTVAPLGTSVPYRFTGAGPDSMRVDSKGNVYVAMMEQGRVMVFAPNGVAISQILLPLRESGHNLESASLALDPHSSGLYIVAGDGEGGLGASIFKSHGVAEGLELYSHH